MNLAAVESSLISHYVMTLMAFTKVSKITVRTIKTGCLLAVMDDEDGVHSL